MNWPLVIGASIAAGLVGLLAARVVSSMLKILIPLLAAIGAGTAAYLFFV